MIYLSSAEFHYIHTTSCVPSQGSQRSPDSCRIPWFLAREGIEVILRFDDGKSVSGTQSITYVTSSRILQGVAGLFVFDYDDIFCLLAYC